MQPSRYAFLFLITGAAAQPPEFFDLNERGIQASNRGEYGEAERLYRQALEGWRALGPEFQGHYATTLYNLGQVICEQGRWGDATRTFTESLEVARRSLGRKHTQTLNTMNALANTTMVLGQVDSTDALLTEALQLERELYPASTQLLRTLITRASLLQRAGNVAEALAPAEEALELATKAAGERSPEAALAYTQVGMIHRAAGRPERALPLLRKARAIYELTLGPQHHTTASVMAQEALVLIDLGKLALAERTITGATTAISRCAGCNYELAVAETNLGLLRLRQQKFDQADAVLSDALLLEEKIASQANSDMVTTLRLLAQVRERQHRPQDAALLRQRASGFAAAGVSQE